MAASSPTLKAFAIEAAPAAFSKFGKKHNKLVQLLAKMRGELGIKALVTEGGILLTIDPKTFPGGLGGFAGTVYTAAISVAGVVPTSSEVTSALQVAYSSATPAAGDIVNLTVSSVVKFRALVTLTTAGATSLFNVAFVVGGVTYYGQVDQTGMY